MSVSTSSSSSSSSSSASSSSSIPRAAALTPSSAYELGLGYLKRRVNNGYPFKPGHCLVSSYAESLKFDMDILASPREVRYAISIPMTLASSSPVALVDSASPNLRLCFQSRRILSAVLTDDLVRSRAEERVDVLAENPLAQKRYFKGRTSMQINTNCNFGTDDLFVYFHKTDLVALVLASGVPFYQISKNPTTGGASLQKWAQLTEKAQRPHGCWL